MTLERHLSIAGKNYRIIVQEAPDGNYAFLAEWDCDCDCMATVQLRLSYGFSPREALDHGVYILLDTIGAVEEG